MRQNLDVKATHVSTFQTVNFALLASCYPRKQLPDALSAQPPLHHHWQRQVNEGMWLDLYLPTNPIQPIAAPRCSHDCSVSVCPENGLHYWQFFMQKREDVT
jgi:hypothetical protein